MNEYLESKQIYKRNNWFTSFVIDEFKDNFIIMIKTKSPNSNDDKINYKDHNYIKCNKPINYINIDSSILYNIIKYAFYYIILKNINFKKSWNKNFLKNF